MMQYLPSLAGVAALSFIIIKLMIPLSHSIGLLDRPSKRKNHSGAIPLIGGICIYLTVFFSSLLFLELSDTFIGIALICGLVTLAGMFDDRYPLQARYRLIMQLMAGVAIAGIGVKVTSLGHLLPAGELHLGLLAIPFTTIAIAGLCNAYNMTDGIDGLAGSLTLVSLGSLLFLAYGQAPKNEVLLLTYLCTSIAIFLAFNLRVCPKIKIFMGDAGSMFLGCAVAIAMIYFSQSNREIINPATTLWLVAIPLMDMVRTMLRRISRHKSPFHADRTHLHHVLTRAGFSSRQALVFIVAVSISFAAIGIFLERVWPQNEALSFILWFAICGLYLKVLIARPYLVAKLIRRKATA
jgi:UDP-GlcNAc:undecaprenyl-phosphate GlcNAc-1-phosphate transferase